MSNFELFMKKNKKVEENVKYAATKSLTDKEGKPLEWEIRHLTSKEIDTIRDNCTKEVPIPGKRGVYKPKMNMGKFLTELAVSSVVMPDLYNKDLQDSYGVMTPGELIRELIDKPGEWADFTALIQEINGFDETLDDKVEEAKN